MIILSFTLWTVADKAWLLTSLSTLFGIASMLYGAFLYFRFRSVTIRLKSLYTFASHTDKLGLQAAIGDDLRALLTAWCRKDVSTIRRDAIECWSRIRARPLPLLDHAKTLWEVCRRWPLYRLWPCFWYLAAALSISWLLWPVKRGGTWTVPIIGDISTDIHPYFGLTIYVVWCVAWVVGPVLLVFLPRRPSQRILLIVDDLDRCEPQQMLEIMESTMLILDDHGVHERLQVCMLVDEAAFRYALCAKYSGLLSDEHLEPTHRYSVDRIIQENQEKFFLAHLRLPPLTDEELFDLTDLYVRQLRSVGDTSAVDQQLSQPQLRMPLSNESAHTRIVEQIESPQISGSVIEPEEAAAIREFIQHHLGAKKRNAINPRTIRCLLFRYQLARDLLYRLGHRPVARELADIVVSVYAHRSDADTVPSVTETIVRQVS